MSFVGLSYNYFFVGELYVLINISATVTDNLLGQKQKAEEKEKKQVYYFTVHFKLPQLTLKQMKATV